MRSKFMRKFNYNFNMKLLTNLILISCFISLDEKRASKKKSNHLRPIYLSV